MTRSVSLPIGLRISIYCAFIGSVLAPGIETVRRWDQMIDIHYFPAWFDDYLMGAFLFFGAWKMLKTPVTGRKYLTAAWGFNTGMMYASFFIHLMNMDVADPSGVSTAIIVPIKGVFFTICVCCLLLSMFTKMSEG